VVSGGEACWFGRNIPLPIPIRRFCDRLKPENSLNPYEASTTSLATPVKRTNWVRGFVIFNLMIIALPMLLVGAISLFMRLQSSYSSWQLSGISGSFGVEIVILLITYLAIPHCSLFTYFLIRGRSNRKKSR
jgi:hypothetical protein